MQKSKPKIYILYSGPQGKSVDRLAQALIRYDFEVEQGTSINDVQGYDAIIAVSTVNAWPTSKFRDSARIAYSANKLMLVRFSRLAASKPHPYTQIVENSLANWKDDDDTDWQALLKRLGLLSGRRGLDELARLKASENSHQHSKLQAWAESHPDDPMARRIEAQLASPGFVPSAEQRRNLFRIALIGCFAFSIIGFAWQTFRVYKINYDNQAEIAWSKVDKRDVSAMRAFLGAYGFSDQAQLAGFLIKEKETEFWERTRELNTIEAYDTYLIKFAEAAKPKPQYTQAALELRDSLKDKRRAVLDNLQTSLLALGILETREDLSAASPTLIEAVNVFHIEEGTEPEITDWDIVELESIEELTARIKVFGRRQMLSYKSDRWANLKTDNLQVIPDSFSNFKRKGGFGGTNNATIYFEDAAYHLSPDSLILLWELAGAGEFVDIIITGHDDGARPRLASFRLAEKRAANVRNALVEFGVEQDIISMKSWGATRPTTANTPDNPTQLNRRVEITFLAR